MPSSTAKYGVPYPTGADPVADGDNTIQSLATRVDLLLGEVGTANITPSAVDTTTTLRVNYSRSYAALAPLVPQPIAVINEMVAVAGTVHLWTSAHDATGFTLNVRSSSVATRNVKWQTRA